MTNFTPKIMSLALFFIISSKFSLALAANVKNQSSELDLMKKKYDPVINLTAEFSQTIKSATLNRKKESSGRIFIRRPNLFRWETYSPEASIMTSNGIKFWYYTPPFRDGEKGQVTIKKANEVPSQLAVDLLAGRVDFPKTFRIERLNIGHFKLYPLKNAGDIQYIELFLENQTNLVYKIRLLSKSGNDTLIILKNIELDAKLDSSMFTLQVPKNTEVME